MADVWRIFVVEGEESLNQSIVHSLRMDGYIVQGILNGADAVRVLWSEEYDVVICGLKTPGVGGLEVLQWLRTYRPNTRLILIGDGEASMARVQALENGAAGYLEKPLDLRQLKEELRCLLQQTGFSADLDSFDLLDVIQMITMSRSKIALLVNAGLEERGLLRFQNGELIWAEYGALRGEEAFFALAAHKNGSVQQQPWTEPVMPNVKLPLARLIFQALQYRTKYATGSYVEEVAPDPLAAFSIGDEDDTPFVVEMPSSPLPGKELPAAQSQEAAQPALEWWERTNRLPAQNNSKALGNVPITPRFPLNERESSHGSDTTPRPAVQQSSINVNASVKLPSWLTDQPTASEMPVVNPTLTHSVHMPATPTPLSSEWPSTTKSTQPIAPKPPSTPQDQLPSGAEYLTNWQSQTGQQRIVNDRNRSTERRVAGLQDGQESGPFSSLHPATRRGYNYAALISALQTLGYSIKGFIAAAVLSLDGQLMAQVTIDEQDLSVICKHFSTMMQGVLLLLDQGNWGRHEDTVITSADRTILVRLVGDERKALQVLVTRREANPADSLEIMANVEAALNAALR